ncbi:hypothetical protein HK104_007349, partial [Borealophlyctis nickersoniae]
GGSQVLTDVGTQTVYMLRPSVPAVLLTLTGERSCKSLAAKLEDGEEDLSRNRKFQDVQGITRSFVFKDRIVVVEGRTDNYRGGLYTITGCEFKGKARVATGKVRRLTQQGDRGLFDPFAITTFAFDRRNKVEKVVITYLALKGILFVSIDWRENTFRVDTVIRGDGPAPVSLCVGERIESSDWRRTGDEVDWADKYAQGAGTMAQGATGSGVESTMSAKKRGKQPVRGRQAQAASETPATYTMLGQFVYMVHSYPNTSNPRSQITRLKLEDPTDMEVLLDSGNGRLFGITGTSEGLVVSNPERGRINLWPKGTSGLSRITDLRLWAGGKRDAGDGEYQVAGLGYPHRLTAFGSSLFVASHEYGTESGSLKLIANTDSQTDFMLHCMKASEAVGQ